MTTVRVTPYDDYPALLMQWDSNIRTSDARAAFENIFHLLNQTQTPLYIVIDLQANPHFPVQETISGALVGLFGHVMLLEWLIVGKNPTARMMGRTLSTFMSRNTLQWFDSTHEIHAYLASKTVAAN